jgi:hypothetical protein
VTSPFGSAVPFGVPYADWRNGDIPASTCNPGTQAHRNDVRGLAYAGPVLVSLGRNTAMTEVVLAQRRTKAGRTRPQRGCTCSREDTSILSRLVGNSTVDATARPRPTSNLPEEMIHHRPCQPHCTTCLSAWPKHSLLQGPMILAAIPNVRRNSTRHTTSSIRHLRQRQECPFRDMIIPLHNPQ